MPLVILAVGIALLLVLMIGFKVNGFVSLTITAFVVGILQGIPLAGTDDNPGMLDVMKDGVANQTGHMILLLGFGAMLGVLMADMGAANRLATTLINKFGTKHSQLAIVLVAFLVGIVLFFETAWVIVIPIVFAIARRYKIGIMWLAVPLGVALSTMHSFLPPHPGPSAVAGIYNASIGKTMLWGLIIAIPIGLLVALVWPRLGFIKKIQANPPTGMVSDKEWTDEEMPGFWPSLILMALPVLLIGGHAILQLTVGDENPVTQIFAVLGKDWFAMVIAFVIAVGYFAIHCHVTMKTISASASRSIKSIAMIVFIIGAGGAFAAVLKAGGISDYVVTITSGLHVSPLILAWLIAAIMRIALGSASVAVVTAAGIVTPLVAAGGVSPELMVLATACGSVIASHVNDPGFWMFKEYLGLNLGDALKVRTGYTTVLAFLGLAGVMLLSLVVPVP